VIINSKVNTATYSITCQVQNL